MPEQKSAQADESSKTSSEEAEYKTPFLSVKKIKPDLRKKELPLVDVKITNPITYLKSWWKRIIGNEGIEFRIRVRPLTAIAMSLIIVSVSFGIGRFVLPFKIPFFEFTPKVTPIPSLAPFRETAFTGTLRFTETTDKYYLITSSSEAITLEVPENIDLEKLIGRRILATGRYYQQTQSLVVIDALDLEILPKEPLPVPTTLPTPTPLQTPEPTVVPTATPESTSTPSVSPEGS